MSIKIINPIILSLLIINLVIVKARIEIISPSYQCGTEGFYTCPRDSTCCYDKNKAEGFTCFAIYNGSCCNVGENELLTACPYNTRCNREKKKCEMDI